MVSNLKLNINDLKLKINDTSYSYEGPSAALTEKKTLKHNSFIKENNKPGIFLKSSGLTSHTSTFLQHLEDLWLLLK